MIVSFSLLNYLIHSLIVSAEARFFEFDEGRFNFTPKRRFSMPNFDKDLLEESRNGNFHSTIKPILSSFQGQIFVYGRHPRTNFGFMGHYGRLNLDFGGYPISFFLVNATFSITHKITDPDSMEIPISYWKVNPKPC